MTGDEFGDVIFQSNNYENVFYGNCDDIACNGVIEAKESTSSAYTCWGYKCWASVTYQLPSPKRIVYFYGRGHVDDDCAGCDASGTLKFQTKFGSDNQWHDLCSCKGGGHEIGACSCVWRGDAEVSAFRVLGTTYDDSNGVKPYELVAWSPVI
jgi:hypothetical protein